ncbi:hypothetical protein DS884_05270 [Tenacibaculum sp. E3R01]|nr:hypothetical protein DS884_05270 [Tenacibaculum sp. E3R01]
MNLKTNFILFIILIFAHIFGSRNITLNIYSTYYVINLMQLIVASLVIFTGIQLLINIFKKNKKIN